nr:hypothetical protein [Tanacetum cinerariifolium]
MEWGGGIDDGSGSGVGGHGGGDERGEWRLEDGDSGGDVVMVSMVERWCKYHQMERMVNGTNHSRVNHYANTVPKAMLIRTGLKPVNSVRPVNPKRPQDVGFGDPSKML